MLSHRRTKLLLIGVFLWILTLSSLAIPPAQVKGWDLAKEHLEFELWSLSGDQASYDGADLIKDYLEDVGFSIKHSAQESGVMYPKLESEGYYAQSTDYDDGVTPQDTARPYDMVYMSLSSSISYPTGLYSLCHTKRDYEGGDNQWGFHNSTMDDHLDFMMNSTLDQVQYHVFQQQAILAEEVPYIHVLYQNDAITVRNGMDGLIWTPSGMISDTNPLSVLNFHNTSALPAGRDGKEWVMRYFRDVRGGDPDGMIYYEIGTGRTAFVDRLLWESPIIVNQTGHIVPWLAESYSVSEDQMQYNFTIRSGVKFHDDTDMTADDWKFSFDWIRANENNSLGWGPSLISYIKNCTVDGDVVSFNMDEFDTWGIFTFTDFIIYPEAIFSTIPYNHTSWHDLTNMTTKVGTGPYKFKEAEATDPPTWWQFERFEDYWFGGDVSTTGLAVGTYPKMDLFTIRVIEDTEATVTAIREGDADLTRYTWSDLTAAAETYTEDIDIVQAKSIWRKILWLNNMVSPLSDKAVRFAIAYAIDYASIVTTAEKGYGFPVYNQYLPAAFFGTTYHNSASDIYTFNKAKANTLLDDAGYLDVDGDGVRDIPGWEEPDDDGAGYGMLEALLLFTGGLLILTIFQKKRR